MLELTLSSAMGTIVEDMLPKRPPHELALSTRDRAERALLVKRALLLVPGMTEERLGSMNSTDGEQNGPLRINRGATSFLINKNGVWVTTLEAPVPLEGYAYLGRGSERYSLSGWVFRLSDRGIAFKDVTPELRELPSLASPRFTSNGRDSLCIKPGEVVPHFQRSSFELGHGLFLRKGAATFFAKGDEVELPSLPVSSLEADETPLLKKGLRFHLSKS